MLELQQQLINETLNTSKFESSRNYISLSNIIKTVEDLLNDYQNGYTANDFDKIKCRLGYHMEAGLKERLLKIKGVQDSFEVVVPGSNGLIKGHTDFTYNNLPGDCKSYARDEYMPKGKVTSKIFWQMNAYMLYMNKTMGFVVAESRETGIIEVIELRRNDNVCNKIHDKVKMILTLL